MSIRIVKDIISKRELADMAQNSFGSLVKAVVDVDRGVVAIGGELHADEEAALLADGSEQENLWGVNLYPEQQTAEMIEFDSMINMRPSQGNMTRGIDDPKIRKAIEEIITKMIV